MIMHGEAAPNELSVTRTKLSSLIAHHSHLSLKFRAHLGKFITEFSTVART